MDMSAEEQQLHIPVKCSTVILRWGGGFSAETVSDGTGMICQDNLANRFPEPNKKDNKNSPPPGNVMCSGLLTLASSPFLDQIYTGLSHTFTCTLLLQYLPLNLHLQLFHLLLNPIFHGPGHI
jgi:hypothetical protein